MLTSLERLEWDIDSELTFLLEDLQGVDDEFRPLAIRLARAAWGLGYVYATHEPFRGDFAREHGYSVERRRPAA